MINEQFLHDMKWYKPSSKSDIKFTTDLKKNSKNYYILEVLKILFLLVTLEVLNTSQLYL